MPSCSATRMPRGSRSLGVLAFLALRDGEWRRLKEHCATDCVFPPSRALTYFIRIVVLERRRRMERFDAAVAKLSRASMMPTNGRLRKSLKWSDELQAGDHIAVWIPLLGDRGYFHHGIYLGDKHCAHYVRGAKRPREVEISEFLEGHARYVVVRYEKEDEDESRALSIDVARYMMSTPGFVAKYDLFTVNCEFFASFCKTGISTSEQIDILEKVLEEVKPLLQKACARLATSSSDFCTVS